MKIGLRKHSHRKSIAARTSGRSKRRIKKLLVPGYGKRKRRIFRTERQRYNRRYYRRTFSFRDLIKKLFKFL